MAPPTTTLFNPKLALLVLFVQVTTFHSAPTHPDLQPLLSFQIAADKSNSLSSWTSTSSNNPCSSSWYGVTCLQNRVSKLVLEAHNLSGLAADSLQPLTSLSHLRVLSLKQNQLSGPLPDFSNLTSLKLLFLSDNDLSGEFPTPLTHLSQLYRLDLSHNHFTGQIPVTRLNALRHLLTLRLEGNRLSGTMSGLDIPNIQDFNVSGNNLAGEIPKSLSGFPESSFDGNPVLCGAPLTACKAASSEPTRPGSDSNGRSGSSPSNPGVTVSSNPSSLPPKLSGEKQHQSGEGAKMSLIGIVAIIFGDVIVLAIISLLLYCYFWRNYRDKNSQLMTSEKIVYSSASPYRNHQGGGGGSSSSSHHRSNCNPNPNGGYERGKMVFFEGAKRFELEDLLRASAEMLGKGAFGTAYKAVLDDGSVVAVKRLRETQLVKTGGGEKEFEQRMEAIGRLRHPNLVGLKAYYFAREEKLMVVDYMPNGSLFWLLHGNRGPGRTPLDWTTRLKIAAGTARGITFIHSTCNTKDSHNFIHGNIKSTNVLIDKYGLAAVSDFGLASLAPPNAKSNGYRSPETLDGRRLTQKADVYSFGVLLLEILTGKCPSHTEATGPYGAVSVTGGVVDLPRWVQSVVREEWTAEVFDLELMRYKDIEEEMVGLLQIAMACTAASPDQRPKMAEVLKLIEEIHGVDMSPAPSHETETFDSDSPPVSDDAAAPSH